MFERILVVAPHPDDEVLGCGGLLARAKRELGARAWTGAAILCADEQSHHVPAATAVLGINFVYTGTWPAEALDVLRLDEIADTLYSLVRDKRPDLVLLPDAGDVHQDHRRAHHAGIVATRPCGDFWPAQVWAYEVPGASDWQFGKGFQPNVFVPVSEADMEMKCKAFAQYASEVCELPHPRSIGGLRRRACLRGVQCGASYAEAYRLVRCCLS